jgi:hypothetical protein
MATIFSDRKLAASFLNRNVILLSEAHRNKFGDLRFGTEFDFGKHGKWSNRIEIPFTNDMLVFQKAIDAYQQNLYDQIGALEELERWATHNPTEKFSLFLDRDKVLFFHGFVVKETLIVQIFGEGLHDFEIRWDFNRAGEHSSLVQKLDELRKTLVEHLRAIEAINMKALVTRSEEAA